MSRIGRKSIVIPQVVKVNVEDGYVLVKGPQGELSVSYKPNIQIQVKEGKMELTCKNQGKQAKALYGLTRSLVANAVQGVSQGFERRLEIVGVGYRVKLDGRNLQLNIGFSHPIVLPAPDGIEFALEEGRRTRGEQEAAQKIIVKGIDRQKVGQTAAIIRSFRPPEPYKGKGIRYEGETIRRKAGKAGKV
ncbi:MAG: 50S ribosomal protein L6 [Candidatus Latescibacteria bacterium]|nr:50S ribosomal protein L6 [Candidatus Latescibacterota bacterium]